MLFPPAFLNGGACREAFQTICMVWAIAFVAVVRMSSDINVAHFRMRQPLNKSAVHDGARADACADRQIGGCPRFWPRRKKLLKRRRINVGGEACGNIQSAFDRLKNRAVPPGCLRRRGDAPVSLTVRTDINRPERTDADGVYREICKVTDDLSECVIRFSRRKLCSVQNGAVSLSGGTDKFRAAGFNTSSMAVPPHLLKSVLIRNGFEPAAAFLTVRSPRFPD